MITQNRTAVLVAICLVASVAMVSGLVSNKKDSRKTETFRYLELERKYAQAVLKSPAGKLKLSLIAFPYGGLDNIGGETDPENSIRVLSQFPFIVCAEPGVLYGTEKYAAESIKNKVKLFGYVNLGGKPLPDMERVQEEINRIAENNWYGVFIDQFGYDFGETRARQNAVVARK